MSSILPLESPALRTYFAYCACGSRKFHGPRPGRALDSRHRDLRAHFREPQTDCGADPAIPSRDQRDFPADSKDLFDGGHADNCRPPACELLADVAFIFRAIQLYQETIGIPEFERLLRPACLDLQVARF